MKSKVLNIILLLTSLIGYLEWGYFYEMFLFQGEIEILLLLFDDPISVIHPFTLLPLIGQLLLLYTLCQKKVSRIITFLGLVGIGFLLIVILIIGLINVNFKMLISTVPFLITAFLTIKHHQKKRISD